MKNPIEEQKIIEREFERFCNKSLNELSAKEEDFLLEQAREKDYEDKEDDNSFLDDPRLEEEKE